MKTIFFLTLCLMAMTCFCQTTRVEYIVSSTNGNRSLYVEFDDHLSTSRLTEEATAESDRINFTVKNRAEGLIYCTDQFFNVIFYVKDTLHAMRWEMLDDTATILDQPCRAAQAYYRGRMYKAFFAPAIPTDMGPGKFGGLPGLILQLKLQDMSVEWNAVAIKQIPSGKLTLPPLAKYSFLPWEEFVAKYKATVAKFIKIARSNGTLPAGTDATLKVDSPEIFYPELHTGEGIKY
ncbi:MAG: GLPGLI family protein [Chitinophagaceae bacterium]|nr:MAG: GLPGLI family protein [Chitinophagaceae bacterium]